MPSILIVDDSAAVLTQMENVLRVAGYEVVATPYGRVALEYLRANSVDLVLTDIYMPDVDGFDLIRIVRQRYPGTPIVAMSADPATFGVLSAASILGAVATLAKPFEAGNLLAAVERTLVPRLV